MKKDNRLIGVSGNFSMTEGNRTCERCGKLFIAYNVNEWAYKDYAAHGKRVWFCSWKCLQEWRKDEGELE